MNWRIVGLATAIAVAVASGLALRTPEGSDLKGELAELSKDLRGKLDPIPRVKPVPRAAYGAGALPDPFYPAER